MLHVSKNTHNLIVRAEEKIPEIGDQVVDEELREVGVVFDIFGPVNKPYIAIRPSVKDPERYVGYVLYVRKR